MELFSQRLSPVPKLLRLARRDGLHLQLQLSRISQRVSPVPTVLHLARRGFFRLLHWLQEQPTSVVLQNVCVFLSDSGAPEEDALSTNFRPADPCERDPVEEPHPDPANLQLSW